MNTQRLFFAPLLLATLSFSGAAAADGAAALMQAVYEQGRIHKSQRMDMEIVVKDDKDRERTRHFKMLYLVTEDGETRSLLRFYKPADIKGTGLFNIVYDEGGKANDQWIYFPAFRRVNKLSTEEKHQSFMGSDFTNADIAGRKPQDDKHTMLRADDKVSVVSSVPHDPEDLYSRIESEILNQYKVPQKVNFYDRDGKLLKTLTAKKIANKSGMYTITEALMENHSTGGSTVMTKEDIDFDAIDPSQLAISQLRNR